ncbi:hypothetical protein BATDEDRAFT_86977 [Batrachochytrium dendrobatidis JAM81]|uniref:Vacuolar protein sorting 55 n=2 Tax=Batrachochytrium dendrobatidis TaxID=109871 RepID=F4NXX0_BATDJ|nr:uncharacterized protein BATDEDRAFT_86977 [Batrachochytrium dendrobatidis JAM81]EGF81918.1 hypothetical protein BATDEDRAFT_86977 [Batrachochytrium dendrobatidis JAM81]KAJ8324466.1 Vacuolar protein sorting-associated protein 55 [Batrachochytrium dendrobatidis]KAK5670715.1 Vacuolar protein sorting-associated protein 55 [Batrachochytrium dendrobatidis]OAJ40616.1 hypothetical protein BDEG_24327 [Batrachochytrium dendrobatidis JEL423]|eukprot:XP_006677574.1 hypothetical protein BATDEDRAFT_86977 [Batrachochytrium dendrobatidis JAM81]
MAGSAGMKTIILLAFLLASGILSVILSCALGNNWLPLLSVLMFLLAPLPNALCKHASAGTSSDFLSDDSNKGILDTGYFITSFFVVSGVALPVVLNHSAVISDLALILSLCGGLLIYITILGYQYFFVDQTYETY